MKTFKSLLSSFFKGLISVFSNILKLVSFIYTIPVILISMITAFLDGKWDEFKEKFKFTKEFYKFMIEYGVKRNKIIHVVSSGKIYTEDNSASIEFTRERIL